MATAARVHSILKVQKWGNSLAVRLPRGVASDADLHLGSTVSVEPTREGLLLRPTRPTRKYRLRDLLAQCKGKTPPPEVDWGPPVGRELI
jgi:antitoxin MazE